MDYNALEKMTVIQLRDEAKKIPDIKSVTGMKKDELIATIVAHLGLAVPEKNAEKKAEKKSGPSAPVTKQGLKLKITELKGEREAARTAGDPKKANMLRKRIHMMKRQLRQMT